MQGSPRSQSVKRQLSVETRLRLATRSSASEIPLRCAPTALRCAALRCRGAAKRFRGVARRERLGGEHLGTPAAHPRHCPIVALQIEQSTEIAGARTMKISVRS